MQTDQPISLQTVSIKLLRKEERAVAIGFLLAIGWAETLAVWTDLRMGLILYSLILIALFLQAAAGHGQRLGRLCLALVLVPLMRIVSISTPLDRFHPVGQYLVILAPLLTATILIIYYLALSPTQIGLNLEKRFVGLRGFFTIALVGLPIGLMSYQILQPPTLANLPTPTQLGLIILVIGISAGFLEELIFRGVLLHLSQDLLGNQAGLLYVSMLFSVLQFGYGSTIYGLLVFAVSLFFGWVALKTRTIYSVSLAHGVINVVNLLLAPIWFAG